MIVSQGVVAGVRGLMAMTGPLVSRQQAEPSYRDKRTEGRHNPTRTKDHGSRLAVGQRTLRCRVSKDEDRALGGVALKGDLKGDLRKTIGVLGFYHQHRTP
ncbi:MAG: hypothetical protein DI528_17965 [Shinella sp.]|nr:MAG: hypothetical protein DI528_17965 [Shinella sp.]